MGPDEKRLYDSVTGSFANTLPALVVVEPGPIDFVGYFSRDANFARAWAQYRLVASVGSIKLFERSPSVAEAQNAPAL
jgi:hypothetical protein